MSKSRPVRVVDPAKVPAVVIVGVGGTGGYVLQQLARLLYGLQAEGRSVPEVLLVDGDTVEEKNLRRQYFLPQDVGRNKAEVLADRYSAAYGLSVGAMPVYLTDATELRYGDYQNVDLVQNGSIVVGCVDNAATRKTLDRQLSAFNHIVYIDSGNSAVALSENADHLDRFELHRLKESGWEGQVVCGVRFNGRTVVPFPAEVFPDLVEIASEADRSPADASCGDVAVSNPQRLMTNLMAATTVLMHLHTLLSDGWIYHSRTFFDARQGYMRSDSAIGQMLEVSA